MNLGEIKTRVKRQFGDESGAQITDADIVRWVNDAQVDIVRRTEILQDHRETNVVSSDGSYELPSDFMFMVRATFDNHLLKQTRMQDIDFQTHSQDTTQAGTPTAVYVWNRTIYLYPKPSVSGSANFDIWFVRAPVAVVVDGDVPEIPAYMHEDIIRFCLARARELDADLDGAERALSDYESRMNQARHELTTQPVDSYPAVRLSPGDD